MPSVPLERIRASKIRYFGLSNFRGWRIAEAVRSVPGIAISQGEDFIVTPFEAELATEGA